MSNKRRPLDLLAAMKDDNSTLTPSAQRLSENNPYELVDQLTARLDKLQEENQRLLAEKGDEKTLYLRSGHAQIFRRIVLKPEEISELTFISPINGREQQFLTPESLNDLRIAMRDGGQIYDAIGNDSGGKIEVLAGSRRRAVCMLDHLPYSILIPDQPISHADALFISEATNAQKPLSHVEKAWNWQAALDEGTFVDQKTLATAVGISEVTLSRTLRAARLPRLWLAQFPDINLLSHTDIEVLLKACTTLKTASDMTHVVNALQQVKANYTGDENMSAERLTKKLVNAAKACTTVKAPTSLHNDVLFRSTKHKAARVALISNPKQDTYTLQLNRLPEALREDLLQAVNQILASYQE